MADQAHASTFNPAWSCPKRHSLWVIQRHLWAIHDICHFGGGWHHLFHHHLISAYCLSAPTSFGHAIAILDALAFLCQCCRPFRIFADYTFYLISEVKCMSCCCSSISYSISSSWFSGLFVTGLLAPQSGALRISAYRDFQSNPIPYPYPIHL